MICTVYCKWQLQSTVWYTIYRNIHASTKVLVLYRYIERKKAIKHFTRMQFEWMCLLNIIYIQLSYQNHNIHSSILMVWIVRRNGYTSRSRTDDRLIAGPQLLETAGEKIDQRRCSSVYNQLFVAAEPRLRPISRSKQRDLPIEN